MIKSSRTTLYIIVPVILVSLLAKADDFRDMITNLQGKMKDAAQDSNTKNHIPHFDEKKASNEGQRLNSIPEGALEGEAHKIKVKGERCAEDPVCSKSGHEAGVGIASKTSDRPPLQGYENLEMFTEADKVYEDPMKQFAEFSGQQCKESENNLNPGFNKVKSTISVTEEIVEKQQCEIPKKILKCEKTLVLGCDTHECDFGGIVEGSVASDMQFEFKNGEMSIGNQDYAGWGGTCQEYDRTTTFEIKDKELIKEFSLIHVRFDDYIEVDVNGHRVYAGPDAGATKAELKDFGFFFFKRKGVDDGTTGQFKPCERSTDWQRAPNTNLLPYIVEGKNSIRFKVITTRLGTGSLKIRAKKNCCTKWKEEWSKRCWAE